MGFKEDIARAKADLDGRRTELVRQIADIDVELKDYEAALRVARKLTGYAPTVSVETQVPASSPSFDELSQHVRKFVGSMKKLILMILINEYPRGMEAKDIRAVAEQQYNVDLNPNTLTVSLGRLKGDGSVRIDGRTWFHMPSGGQQESDEQQEDAPPAETGGALDFEGSA